ncbi:MAG: cysteine--tRNA ligase [Candidatus Nomurabacteria bacterium]|jgi:cysteinyl-tRNA synthetase|nr:cysteine--tRNA ligase [Candidatus Nomurabacteria bacterium]
MKLYNTLTRRIEDFTPQDPKRVKIYTCGPTVYSHAHIGNFTAYVYWDLLIRTIRLNGWQEDRVLNITDVGHLTSDGDEGEDKLEKGARREGKTVWQVAEYYMDDFLENFTALGVIAPTKIARATDYIEADIYLINNLTERGYTYETSDGIYYDTSKFPTYADFAHLDLEHLKAGARVEFNPEKHSPSDFALWKWVREGEDHAMQWEYLGRMGYPGWHIECSSIIHETLGEPIDIHTGGVDHIPVHHTNEIAQSEAAFDVLLSRFWLHNNFITIDGRKISKSLGNVYNFDDLQKKGFTHLDYRMWVLQGHYRSERNFSFEELSAAHQRLMNYRNFAALRHQKPATNTDEIQTQITEALNNNLSSAEALATLDKNLDHVMPSEKFIEYLDDAFGLQLAASTPDITSEQKELISNRAHAKASKDYQASDQIRDQLEKQGIAILDTPTGTIWQLA